MREAQERALQAMLAYYLRRLEQVPIPPPDKPKPPASGRRRMHVHKGERQARSVTPEQVERAAALLAAVAAAATRPPPPPLCPTGL